MGGLGSGRWGYGYKKRNTVEECRRLDVRTLRRKGVLREGRQWRGSWAWWNSRGEETASVNLAATAAEIILRYRIRETGATEWEEIGYTVPVVWTRYNFGGKRPFFLCPNTRCGRRVEILYLPLYIDAHYFLCRHCHGLSYESTQTWNKKVAFYRRHPEAALAVLRDPGAQLTDLLAAMRGGLRSP